MDFEVSDVNLCALHCELRNTEQLLMSLGLTAHRCGSLKECNLVLAEYGPETMVKDRIVVKLKEGQDTDVQKHNIKIRSFSGINFKVYAQSFYKLQCIYIVPCKLYCCVVL